MTRTSSRPFLSFAQLEAFVAAAECRSFTYAARSLGISQPAISHAIKNLEEQLHRQLFTRHTSGITLTEVGARLLPHARQAVDSAHAAIRATQPHGSDHQDQERVDEATTPAPRAGPGRMRREGVG